MIAPRILLTPMTSMIPIIDDDDGDDGDDDDDDVDDTITITLPTTAAVLPYTSICRHQHQYWYWYLTLYVTADNSDIERGGICYYFSYSVFSNQIIHPTNDGDFDTDIDPGTDTFYDTVLYASSSAPASVLSALVISIYTSSSYISTIMIQFQLSNREGFAIAPFFYLFVFDVAMSHWSEGICYFKLRYSRLFKYI